MARSPGGRTARACSDRNAFPLKRDSGRSCAIVSSDLKFVRQAPIGPYFVDFLCREQKLVVEVDGGTHTTEAEVAADARRMQQLQGMGYRVFRAHNTDIYENIDGVLDTLLALVEERAP